MSRHRYGDGFLFCNGLDASQTSQAPASVRLIVGTSKKCQTFSFSSGLWSDVPDMKVRSRVKCNDEMNVAFSVFYLLLCSSPLPSLAEAALQNTEIILILFQYEREGRGSLVSILGSVWIVSGDYTTEGGEFNCLMS